MEIWQAHYQDQFHDLPCSIENHWGNNQAEDVFKMCIDGITFVGSDLDDWELSKVENEENIDSIAKKFSLLKYGYQEKGYHFMLQSYKLNIKIPTVIFSFEKQCRISSEINVAFKNTSDSKEIRGRYPVDDKYTIPNASICEKFNLTIENLCFSAEKPSTFFEESFQAICNQLNGKYYLCNCFGCLYSDYHPCGQGNIGSICCFEKNKENYLRVYSKYEGEYTIWDAFDEGGIQCQETNLCEYFVPRINCLGGYRGEIYT